MTIEILPLDLSANKPSNRKQTVVNPANPLGKGFVVCPEWGAFYTDTLVVRDAYNAPLTRGVDYQVAYLYEEFTLMTSNEVMGLILIDGNKKPPFKIEAQYVGGEHFVSANQIKQAIEDVLNSELFKFSFWDILNRPTEFVPSKHQHEFWQLLGMDTTVNMVKEINKALLDRFNRDNPIIKSLKNYADNKISEVKMALDELERLVNDHYGDYNNPHLDDKVKLGLGNVTNLSLASDKESLDPNCDYRYQSAYGVFTQINVSLDLNSHIQMANPHQTTINQLGGLTKAQWNVKFDNYLDISGIAFNATTLENKTLNEIYSLVGKDLKANEYSGPIWTPNRLGINSSNEALKVLCADQTYRPLSWMFNNYPVNKNELLGVGYFPNETLVLTHLNDYHSDVPDGTVAIANIEDTYPFDYLLPDLITPLDPTSKIIGNAVVYLKTESNWTKL